MFEIFITDAYQESFQKLDVTTRELIKERLLFLSRVENPLFYAKKLAKYKDIFRFRAGNYRVIFRLAKNRIILLFAKHRKDVYEKL